MNTHSKELQYAIRSFRILEEALTALREQLATVNPDLLAATAPAYTQRIIVVKAEIRNLVYRRRM
jgi:hypothetical protein